MVRKVKCCCGRFWRRTQGVAAVEFALLSTILIFIVAGIVDFGHAWYIQQKLTSASEVGARYAVTYRIYPANPATRVSPISLNPTISNYVKDTVLLNSGLSGVSVLASGPGLDGVVGHPITVKVSANKTWFLLGAVLPSGILPGTLSASTVMNNQ